jgi:hypothetical protein
MLSTPMDSDKDRYACRVLSLVADMKKHTAEKNPANSAIIRMMVGP